MGGSKPILLVEDNQATTPTAGAVLDELGIRYATVRVSDVTEALAYLQKNPHDEPSVILIDSANSKTQVLALVKAVKQDERFRSIPIVTLTPSGDAGVVNESFDLGAVGYVVKPSDRQKFTEAVRAICQYWTLSRVPADV